MCGIVGIIDPGHPDKASLLRAMSRVIQARGPDGEGSYLDDRLALGMRRLSVIDLAHGQQPLTSAEGRVLAFQNGEIYNHLDLRAQLIRSGNVFRTESDTEVLAHGYSQWGLDGLLQRLDGMYAIAILDLRSRQLHLARDRFGEKPLYFTHRGDRFAYASDLRALAALPWVSDQFDPLSLSRYLALHYIPGERTILSAVNRLLPGESLTLSIDDPQPRRSRYYRLALRPGSRANDDTLAACIENAVASRLVADVPVGVFLSGGLDSSIVAALAARHAPGLDTFSIGFDSSKHDESECARRMAAHIGSRHHHFQFDGAAFNSLLPQVAAALDEPLGDQAALPLYWLCREARQHVTVALAGEGADEVFAGYSYYAPFAPAMPWWQRWFARLRKRLPVTGAATFIDEAAPFTPSGFPLLSGREERQALLGQTAPTTDAWESDLMAWLASTQEPLTRATAADLATWLPDDLLVKFDRMAMANSLEGRAPFLQPDLVEIGVNRLSPNQRMASSESKIALRRVAQRWLPPDIMNRPKKGFVLPMAEWLHGWFANAGGVAGWLERVDSHQLDRVRLTRIIEDDLAAGIRRERLLFALVMFHEWHDNYQRTVSALRDEYMSIHK